MQQTIHFLVGHLDYVGQLLLLLGLFLAFTYADDMLPDESSDIKWTFTLIYIMYQCGLITPLIKMIHF